jgi:hypothetical protein
MYEPIIYEILVDQSLLKPYGSPCTGPLRFPPSASSHMAGIGCVGVIRRLGNRFKK